MTSRGLAPSDGSPFRVHYVLKRYPRLSETFILNELIGMNGHGVEVSITSLMPKETGQPEHPMVREVRASVTYTSAIRIRLGAHLRVLGKWPRGYLSAAAASARTQIRDREAQEWRAFRRAVLAADNIRANASQHIHAHFATSATQTALIAGQITGLPVSFTAHAKDIYQIDEAGLGRLRSYMKRAALIVTISDFNMRYMAEIAPEHQHKLRHVSNGLAPDWLAETPERRRPSIPVILGVGRLVEKKGFGDLVSACAILRERGVQFRCRIVGSGPMEHALRKQVLESDLIDDVVFVGSADQETLRTFHYPRATCAVVPCQVASTGDRDGLPTVILESMAMGLPVIATDVTAIPEVVLNEETGLLVEQRDPVALADAIQRLIEHPQLADSLAANAKALIVRRFDRRETTRLLRSLLIEAGASAPRGSDLRLQEPAPQG